jgi:predicted nucleic acid-binding protein
VVERADSAGFQIAAATAREAEKSLLIYLLDTCVLSEATLPRQNAGVMAWISAHEMARQYVSAVTIGELYFGVERLPDGGRRKKLRDWVGMVEEDYAGRIVPLDLSVAAHWGQLRAHAPNAQTVDAQLAATALAYGFTFITRNVKHFKFAGLSVVNPWMA